MTHRPSARPTRVRPTSVALAIGLLASLAAVLPAGPAAAAPSVRWTALSSAFSAPVQVTSPRDGTGRLFVVEKTGLVRVWRNNSVAATPFLDLRSSVSTSGERGLLSIAFARNGTTSYLFTSFTDLNGAMRVVRWRIASSTAPTVDYSNAVVLMVIPHPTYSNHNGGQLLVRSDGTLLITTGDGGGSGDPFANAQSVRSLLGKVLRIDPWRRCSPAAYCVPSDNPFATVTGPRREIIHWGLRNPWRASIDPATNVLWMGDVGQSRYEEINVARVNEHRNFGWSCYEGRVIYNSARCPAGANYTAPVGVYGRTEGASIIGGFVYRGVRYPALRGFYVYGDFVSGRVWTANSGRILYPQRLPQLTSFGEGDNRELFATTYDGRLWRMSYA